MSFLLMSCGVRRRRYAWASSMAAMGLAFMTSAVPVPRPAAATTTDATLRYWTAERLARAKPKVVLHRERQAAGPTASATHAGSPAATAARPPLLGIDLPRAETLFAAEAGVAEPGKEPRAAASLDWLPFSSRRIVVDDLRRTYPYRAVGKLFATFPGVGDFTCSASVVGRRLVATAGHCLYDQFREREAANVLFVPGFDQHDGVARAPFGRWAASAIVLPPDYVEPFDGAIHEADFAIAVMADRPMGGTMRRVGEVTGSLGWRTYARLPDLVHQLGYPLNLDGGRRLQETATLTIPGSSFEERTREPLNGLAALLGIYGGPQEDGASGGPLIADMGVGAMGDTSVAPARRNQIVGVVSFGFVAIDYAGGFTVLNARWQKLYERACNQRAGNC